VFTLGHPEKVIDFAYRAMHEMTVQSKSLIKAFLRSACVSFLLQRMLHRGRQGLMEAQRYPEDFDGIIAGAPANDHLYLHAGDMARMIDIFKDPKGLIP
jgi:feruloyl esterase